MTKEVTIKKISTEIDKLTDLISKYDKEIYKKDNEIKELVSKVSIYEEKVRHLQSQLLHYTNNCSIYEDFSGRQHKLLFSARTGSKEKLLFIHQSIDDSEVIATEATEFVAKFNLVKA